MLAATHDKEICEFMFDAFISRLRLFTFKGRFQFQETLFPLQKHDFFLNSINFGDFFCPNLSPKCMPGKKERDNSF